MKHTVIAASIACLALAAAGCKKTADNTVNYKSAINAYYASRPACLFAKPVEFPKQERARDNPDVAPYQALVDQGLLTRTTDEKKKLLVFSEQVTNYDLSDKGRSAWTANPQQPGFGNFCYGTRTVSSIDASTPNSGQPGATTTVNYHAGISGAPSWLTASETQNAFPQVKNDLASSANTAVLTDTPSGWSVTQGPAGPAHSANDPDANIVQ